MRGLLLFVAAASITNCKKEKDLSQLQEKNNDADAERRGNSKECRLTQYYYYDAIHDFEQIDGLTYKNGLVDEWSTFYGTTFKMEYGRDKKMKAATAYIDGELISTIHFIRKNNKIVKEIWYVGNTDVVDDEVINTYNRKGQLIKNESLNYDYYVLNTYTPHGNLESWTYYGGGLPVSAAVYTYKEDIKTPYLARPGIEYSFAWINSAFGSGDRWYSSEQAISYDENGEPYLYYDQDPKKTKWQRGDNGFPIRADYIDRLTGGLIINSFQYENCTSCRDFQSSAARSANIANNKAPKGVRSIRNSSLQVVLKRRIQ